MSGDLASRSFDRVARHETDACADGRLVRQVEPFLEKLIQIHERLSAGLRPADLEGDPCLWAVYEAERCATGAPIGFHEAAAAGDFEVLLADLLAARALIRNRIIIAEGLDRMRPIPFDASKDLAPIPFWMSLTTSRLTPRCRGGILNGGQPGGLQRAALERFAVGCGSCPTTARRQNALTPFGLIGYCPGY